MYSTELLRALPKTDLHVHLDGSLRLSTLLELARDRGVELPSDSEEGMRELVFKDRYGSLSEYLRGFQYTCAVLQDAEALERAAYELAWDNIEEGVRYVEVRFAPHLHMRPGFGYAEVLLAVQRGLDRASSEHAGSEGVRQRGEPVFRFGIIVCAMRFFTAGFSRWFSELFATLGEAPPRSLYATAALDLARAAVRLRNEAGLKLAGFDLAGDEAGYPAENYEAAFRFAQEHFMHKTVHAGEGYGAESIFQAVSVLDADRIGHGLHLFEPDRVRSPKVTDREDYVRDLIQYIGDRRVTVEVCITSNLQTNPEIGSVKGHPFRKMLDSRLSATLCTDNRLVSNTSVTREYELAQAALDMTPREIRNTVIYGFKRSFFPGSYLEKRAWVREIIDHYDTLVSDG
jgi:adenosine deaminase